MAGWNVNDQGIHGTYYSIQGGRELLISDQLVGAFQVSGDAVVPQPASVTLLGIGAFAMLGYAWRRRKPLAA